MLGRIRRRALAQRIPDAPLPAQPGCPLCGRPIPDGHGDAHHLVPKSEGGTATVQLHRMCHRQIHALIPERELAREYASIEALLRHPGVARYVQWVRNKPGDLRERTRKSVGMRAGG